MKGRIIGAALVPGLPHLLSTKVSAPWNHLREALIALEKTIADLKPEVFVIYSTQWMSVLGTSFQSQPRLKGIHVDENWHEWGDLEFDFKSEVALSEGSAQRVSQQGFPTKLIAVEEFPIDTGTIVALKFLNTRLQLPVAIVSSWVYADGEKSRQIGTAMAEAVEASGKRAFVLGISSLSQRFFSDDIAPESDHLSSPEDDECNRRILGQLETGAVMLAAQSAKAFAALMPVDMQGNALFWLAGICGDKVRGARVMAYEPIWGTGNTVTFLAGDNT